MANYPPGITTATIRVGTVMDFFGDQAALSVKVAPVLGTGVSHVVHSPTGTALAAIARKVESDPATGVAEFVVPHTDGDGWTDPAGNAVTGWFYRVTVTARAADTGTYSASWTKDVQPITGQGVIDLELVPSGEAFAPTVAPAAAVLSVNGETGHVLTPPDAVTSVNGATGDVVLSIPDPAPVLSVNGETGHVVLATGGGGGSAAELTGIGMPEGVVTASPGTYYTDTAGTNGAWRWLKTSGTGNTGWAVIYGNTGWRNMTGHKGAGMTSGLIMWRRVNDIEYTQFRGLTFEATSVSDTLYIPPTGFQPERSTPTIDLLRDNNVRQTVQFTHGRGYWRTQSLSLSTSMNGEFTEPVSRPWPMSLPGVAA